MYELADENVVEYHLADLKYLHIFDLKKKQFLDRSDFNGFFAFFPSYMLFGCPTWILMNPHYIIEGPTLSTQRGAFILLIYFLNKQAFVVHWGRSTPAAVVARVRFLSVLFFHIVYNKIKKMC